jgi:cellulose synthase (UDP-forming)
LELGGLVNLFDLDIWTPVALVAGLIAVISLSVGSDSASGRFMLCAISMATNIRYVLWRWIYTIPEPDTLLATLWVNAFFTMELCSQLGGLLITFFMSRTVDRSKDANSHQTSCFSDAPVDVFIATYNESREILERTIVGATAIHHNDLRVWLLDDGARPEIKRLAAEHEIEYAFRVKGAHAKAGNVNNGLRLALATSRPPQFILLLDADFVPRSNILQRTLGFFKDPKIGIVQTPQHFFNHDPIQINLGSTLTWPDEQRFFFNYLLACKDAWGAAFCCGTSAVFRVNALQASGGMATETVTEDMLTTFRLEEYGYKTIFLNEYLSSGLAPEGLTEFVTQRSRWCLGAIQQIYTRWSFAGPARISFINRLSAFDGILYWCSSFLFRLMVLIAPIIYWMTGISVIDARIDELAYYQWPFTVAICSMIFTLSKRRVVPILSDISQMISTFIIIRTVITTLIKPWGRPFKVTPKGKSTERTVIHWQLAWPFMLLAAAIVYGLAVNVSPYAPLNGERGYTINVIWSLVDVLLLLATVAACIELPRKSTVTFPTTEDGTLLCGDVRLPCHVREISTESAKIAVLDQPQAQAATHLLLDDDILTIPIINVAVGSEVITVEFVVDRRLRQALLKKLFSGGYHIEIDGFVVGKAICSVLRRLFL